MTINQMRNSKLTEKCPLILRNFLVSKLSENELMSTIYGQLSQDDDLN